MSRERSRLLVLRQQTRYLLMPPPSRPCQRLGPRQIWKIVGQVRLSSASQKELDYPGLAEFGRPRQRCRTELLLARMQIGAVFDEQCGAFHVAVLGELVQRRNARPVGMVL